jgi:hypothetical protein
MKFRHAAAAITAMLVMNLATAQTAAPARAGTAPAAAGTAAKPGANPATDPATPGMPKTETSVAPVGGTTAAIKPGDATAGQGKAAACGVWPDKASSTSPRNWPTSSRASAPIRSWLALPRH